MNTIMKKLKNITGWTIGILCFITQGIALASSPVTMLEGASNALLSALSNTQNRDEKTLSDLITKIILPHMELDQMSEKVVGKYWLEATPTQRTQFKDAFTRYVIHTYSAPLASYTKEKVQFFPIREGSSGKSIEVHSVIEQLNGQNLSVTYRLIVVGSTWKIIDFSVENVSLVDNYHAQFAEVLRIQGIEGLIQKLQHKNQ